MSFELLKKGFEEQGKKEFKKTELSQEERQLLSTKEIDSLTARAKMRLQFIKNRIEHEKLLSQEQKDSLSD